MYIYNLKCISIIIMHFSHMNVLFFNAQVLIVQKWTLFSVWGVRYCPVFRSRCLGVHFYNKPIYTPKFGSKL